MTGTVDLAALLGSRICHDLISPIGAIGNGVELLALEGMSHGPEIALITESVASASARIRFFRVAFGVAGVDQRMSQREILSILADLSKGSRLNFDWQGPSDVARAEAKAAFLMILCLETAMPYGGVVEFGSAEGKAVLRGISPKMKQDQDLWDLLRNSDLPAGLGAGEVHFALLAKEMQRQGRSLALAQDATEIRFSW